MKITPNREIRIPAYVEEAYRVKVTVKGLEAYMDAWLVICNNVRSWPQLLKAENNNGNDIFVFCKPSALKDTTEWLEGFGEVDARPTKVLVAYVNDFELDWDMDTYDEIIVTEE